MKKFPLLIALPFMLATQLRAVILFGFDTNNVTGDPSANTSAPVGTLANTAWQYEADWGGFLGTPIAPNFFISAAHIGQAGNNLSFQDVTYSTIGSFSLSGSDFLIWKVDKPFPSFAPLYTGREETGQHLVVIGRGTQRGGEITLDGTLRGWGWGPGDGKRRWGENDVTKVVLYQGHDLLYATFDQSAGSNESHLSSGDSGGAVFINDGIWKVAGINYAVDDLYTSPSSDTLFNAAIFDARGYYTTDPNDSSMFVQISGADPVPSGFYASRISSELAWIGSVIADPQVGRDGNFLTLTYWRLNVLSTDIAYEVVYSADLITWMTATTQDEVIATAGDLKQIKAKIDPGTADHLFVRLKVTRP